MALAERLIVPLLKLRVFLRGTGAISEHEGVLHPRPVRPQAPAVVSAPPQVGLTIHCPDPTGEDRARDTYQNHALRLIRQEDWDRLAVDIAQADAARDKTDGGMSVADLLAYGARADVVAAAEHALISGKPDRDAPLLAGIEALEVVLAERPECPMTAAIVAHAHMDIGWAWRGAAWDTKVPQRNHDAFDAHFDRAAEILHPYDARTIDSPLLAGAHCARTAGQGSDTDRVVAAYDHWITLDPQNARALRALGGHLLPRWNGSYDRLESEARRMAAQSTDIWGAGAYTWVMFDAIATDTAACAQVDLDLFVTGLRDILRHTRDQHVVNLLTAYCANTMGAAPTGHDGADHIRAQIALAGEWIARDHLREVHPMLWAHAARGFDTTLRVRSPERFAATGRADALAFLTDLFQQELSDGQQVIFGTDGVETHAA